MLTIQQIYERWPDNNSLKTVRRLIASEVFSSAQKIKNLWYVDEEEAEHYYGDISDEKITAADTARLKAEKTAEEVSPFL